MMVMPGGGRGGGGGGRGGRGRGRGQGQPQDAFALGGEERLQKFLSHAGLDSRRQCEQMILDGRVRVNGKMVKELGVKVGARPGREGYGWGLTLRGVARALVLSVWCWRSRALILQHHCW